MILSFEERKIILYYYILFTNANIIRIPEFTYNRDDIVLSLHSVNYYIRLLLYDIVIVNSTI